jgi:carboxylesterase type B
VSILLQQLKENNVNTLWIQEESDLTDWKSGLNDVEELLIGDVEYESVIWRNGLETVPAEEISEAFDTDSEYGPTLKHLYGITSESPTSSRTGALDFINDARFAMPVDDISRIRHNAGKRTYQYVFDQPNPFQASSRAHHGVDLLFLFGSSEYSFFDPSAENVKDTMMGRWAAFINGKEPWSSEIRHAFGPHGKCGKIDEREYSARRRVKHFGILRKMNPQTLVVIFGMLAGGRISLLN